MNARCHGMVLVMLTCDTCDPNCRRYDGCECSNGRIELVTFSSDALRPSKSLYHSYHSCSADILSSSTASQKNP